jgi:hypothetical protein
MIALLYLKIGCSVPRSLIFLIFVLKYEKDLSEGVALGSEKIETRHYDTAVIEITRELMKTAMRLHIEEKSEVDAVLTQRARDILDKRLSEVVKLHGEFALRLKDANVKNHCDALMEGHLRDMRHFLRADPGVGKETARLIVDEILTKK